MKLALLEDGVLDYKGDGLTLATPNAVPTASIGAGIKPAPKSQIRSQLKQHIEDCPKCGKTLCDVAQRLVSH